MFKLLFTILVSVSIGRFLYSEVGLVAPPLVPALDYVLEATTIPTHDQWSKDSFEEILKVVDKVTQHAVKAFKESDNKKPRAKPIIEAKGSKRTTPNFKEINEQLAALQARLAVSG